MTKKTEKEPRFEKMEVDWGGRRLAQLPNFLDVLRGWVERAIGEGVSEERGRGSAGLGGREEVNGAESD